MAASETVIGNAALHKLGENPVTSFSDDSPRARALLTRYEPIRDQVLRMHRWTFAMSRASLSADADEPAFDYSLQFTLPADCLQLVQINGAEWTPGLADYIGRHQPMFHIEGRKVLTDIAAPLPIRYVARIEDPTLHDPLFDEALACRLAYDLCERISQSGSKKEAALRDYQLAIREAVRVNAIEQATEEASDGSWVVSRL